MSYLRPDFSLDKNPKSSFVSLLYKVAKDGKVDKNVIDGYWEFSIIDQNRVLEKKKINEDKMVLATLGNGEVLYIDDKGNIIKEFPKL